MKNLIQQLCCQLACASVMLFGLPHFAQAQIVYDNGPPDHVSGNNLGFANQAEDFRLSAGQTLTDVHFWSLEQSGAYRGSISWSILGDVGGVPGAVLASGTQGLVSRTSLGSVLGLNEYRNDFDLNVQLALGTGNYWLVLHNGSFADQGDPNEFLWETAAANATMRGQESFDNGATWGTNFNEHAFQVSAVPEPAAVLMLLAGMVLVGSLRRRNLRTPAFAD